MLATRQKISSIRPLPSVPCQGSVYCHNSELGSTQMHHLNHSVFVDLSVDHREYEWYRIICTNLTHLPVVYTAACLSPSALLPTFRDPNAPAACSLKFPRYEVTAHLDHWQLIVAFDWLCSTGSDSCWAWEKTPFCPKSKHIHLGLFSQPNLVPR